MNLWAKILLAIFLGVVTGIFFGPQTVYIKPVGTLFLNLLNMLIVPLVFSSMVCGVTSTKDSKKLGRIGIRALIMYACTTVFAILLGLSLANYLQLGTEIHLQAITPSTASEMPHFSDLILSVIPRNPIQAFAEGNILQIIVFSVFFGVSLNLAGDKAKPIIDCIHSLAQVMFRMTSFVMMCSPIGVFALMAWATGSFGLEVLLPVVKFLMVYYIAAAIHILFIFCSILYFMARVRPLAFFRGIREAIITAISTCSSSATLPSAMTCATEKLGISKGLASFVMPLGCSLNMNGSALFQAMSALFIAQAYGIELYWQHMLIIASTVILATIGTASIPGGGLLMLSIVFSSVGIPLEGIAILAGIDRLRDMATTVLNVAGDAVCAVWLAKQEGELNETIYYQIPEPALSQSKA